MELEMYSLLGLTQGFWGKDVIAGDKTNKLFLFFYITSQSPSYSHWRTVAYKMKFEVPHKWTSYLGFCLHFQVIFISVVIFTKTHKITLNNIANTCYIVIYLNI